jgi:hypothetical protein
MTKGGLRLHSLLKLDLFSPVAEILLSAAEVLARAPSLTLICEPTLIGILGMAQIEAAALDSGMAYRRQISGEKDDDRTSCIIISENSETSWDSDSQVLVLGEVSVDSVMGHDMKTRTGILQSTSQAAALAAIMAAEGKRVRRLRGWACAGQWLRGTLDQVYDPVWTRLRDHLKDEGSVRILTLPEVEVVAEEELQGLSPKALKRLRKAWPTMDFHLRSSALSELMMMVVSTSGQSAPRIEELGWHRLHAGSWPSDLASMIYHEVENWPTEDVISHSMTRLDTLISAGHL